jgi:cation:H+ antiporter
MTALLLLAAFVLIVVGALGFTNAIEWLGQRLNLGASAVGAILAAVGTALPESMIPVVALAGGSKGAEDIAIGSIIGAPFLLGTLAMILVAASSHGYKGRRSQGGDLEIDLGGLRRDLGVFLVLFPIGVLLGLGAPKGLRIAGAVVLLVGYGVYVWRTATQGGDAGDPEELRPLRFDTTPEDPPSNAQIALQLVVSLAAIIGGAELFVGEVEKVAVAVGLATLILALILAPLATELPEKINSVLWVRQGKDDLALGNVTGALTFQSAIPVAIGLVFTEWTLDRFALLASGAAVLGGIVAYFALGRGRYGLAPTIAWSILFAGFVGYAVLAS